MKISQLHYNIMDLRLRATAVGGSLRPELVAHLVGIRTVSESRKSGFALNLLTCRSRYFFTGGQHQSEWVGNLTRTNGSSQESPGVVIFSVVLRSPI